jgi:hypothetical protein
MDTSETDQIELVNATAVEEVLQDIGMLAFGKGVTAKASRLGAIRQGFDRLFGCQAILRDSVADGLYRLEEQVHGKRFPERDPA